MAQAITNKPTEEKLSEFLQNDRSIKLYQEALNINSKEKSDKAIMFAQSMMLEIERTIGSKSDISKCDPKSIRQAIIDSVKLDVMVDKRQHAHLVPRGGKCHLEIGYRGYIATLTKHLKNVDFTIEPVFNDDDFSVNDHSGFQTYTHTKKNPFRNHKDLKGLIGMYCCITYTHDDKEYSRIAFMSEAEIGDIKSVCKQDFIWKAWPMEMRKKTVIKRACKVMFNNLVEHLDEHDNKDYDLEQQQNRIAKQAEAETTASITSELSQIANDDGFNQDEYDKATDEAKVVTQTAEEVDDE